MIVTETKILFNFEIKKKKKDLHIRIANIG